MNKNIAVFDIEASEWTNFYYGGLYDGEEYYIYDNVKELLKKITEYNFVYGFFNSKYDNNFLLEEIFKKRIDIRFIIVNGKMIYLKINKTNTVIKDLWKFSPMTLEKSYKVFINNKHKGKYHINYKNIKNYDKEVIIKYLKNDLLITYELAIKLHDLFNIKKNYSISGVALKQFRTESGEDFKYSKKNQFIENKINVFGGRCEMFRKSGNNIYIYDINSEYPAIFYNNKIPYDIDVKIKNPDKKILKELINKKYLLLIEGIYRDIPDKTIPLIPFRDVDNSIYYLYGDKTGYFYSDCIDINKLAYIKNIWIMKTYEKNKFNFIKKWYELKKTNYTYKILLNSFYGKMLQKPIRDDYKIIYNIKTLQEYINNKYEVVYENKFGFIVKKEKFNPYLFHNRFIGKYITDKSRFNLTRDINKLLINNIKVYYCDTDSIHTEKTASNFLDVGDKLGEYKLENIASQGIYINPKHYSLYLRGGRVIEKLKGGMGYINMSLKKTLKTAHFTSEYIKKETISNYESKKRLDKKGNIYYYYTMRDLNLNKELKK